MGQFPDCWTSDRTVTSGKPPCRCRPISQRSSQQKGATSHLFVVDRLVTLFTAAFFARASSLDWMVCALTIATIRPGKRCSSSAHREVLCISTPRRSPRINPASRNTLKCCESVDFGMALSLTVRNIEQLCVQSCATISAKIATRTGSDKAYRTPSTVMSSIDGWNSGRTSIRVVIPVKRFNSS
jgi:hypothetical protein